VAGRTVDREHFECADAVATDVSTTSPSPVKVRINTDPDGASVREDGVELCSSTPCDILYKGADADPTREHKLTFTRNGYRLEIKSVKVGDSPVTVKLTVAPAGVYLPAPQPKDNTAPQPTVYKEIPY
jgi:serine/threonine-protein kinase